MNPLLRVENFEYAMNPESCGSYIRTFFVSSEVKRLSPVLYSEYCIQDGDLDACFVANIPRGVLRTRVNPDTCQIRVYVEIFESGKKKLRIKKYPDTCGRGLRIVFLLFK